MRDYHMRTGRLGFSRWTRDDLPLLRGIFGDPVVTRFEGGDWTDRRIADRLEKEMANLEAHGVQYWPVFLLSTGKHVGCCGLRPHDLPHGVWELGCQLRRAFWSYGLGREAAEAVIEHAFAMLGAQALYAGHHPENVASGAFLRHLGFAHTHDEFYALTQLMEPCYLLTRDMLHSQSLAAEGRTTRPNPTSR